MTERQFRVLRRMALAFVVIGVSVVLLQRLEPTFSLARCLWLLAAASTTCGFGDTTPTNDASRVFLVAFMLVSWLLLGR